jgi:hypothetical protein
VSETAVASESAATVKAAKAARTRSPNYPGISLRTAIDRARVFYNNDKRNWSHVDTALHHWGFKPRSGAGLVVLAALKSFGLLQDDGSGTSRRVRLTDFALKVLLLDDAEHAPERQRLLQDAALKPKVHADLWKHYRGSLPSDVTLRYELMTQRGFTENAVKEFIPQFKDTIAFANLAAGDKLTGNDGDNSEATLDPFAVGPVTVASASAETRTASGQVGQERPNTRVVNLPLSGDAWAALQVPFPMSEDDWDQMLAVLNAMKRGIVRKRPTAEEESKS